MKPGPKPKKWLKVAKFLQTKQAQTMTLEAVAKHCGVSLSTASSAWCNLDRGRREQPQEREGWKACEEAARLWASGLSKARISIKQRVTRSAVGDRIRRYCKKRGVRCEVVVKHRFVKVTK